MHIEKRQIGKKTKYYLAHAIRDGKNVKKIRIYLGNNPEDVKKKRIQAEQILKERVKAYEKISNPFRSALSSEELEEIKTLEAKGKIDIKHLSEDDWHKFAESFVYDTNAIEGSSVTYSEVREIVENGNWPPQREKWEISETYGVRQAIDYIRKSKDHISLNLIKEIHQLCFKNSKTFAGELRKMGEEVAVIDGLGNIIHRGAPSQLVPKLLKDLISWYSKNKNKYSPIVLAVVVHNQFETIHPFADGNGRVGRLLLNNILLKNGMPPINIELRNRKEYYSALREYQTTGNIRPMIELILKEYRYLKKLLGR
jgi:Fic family protein